MLGDCIAWAFLFVVLYMITASQISDYLLRRSLEHDTAVKQRDELLKKYAALVIEQAEEQSPYKYK